MKAKAKLGGKLKIQGYKDGTYKLRSKGEALRLHCLDCCGGDPKISRDCGCKTCLLFDFNPWNKNRRKGSVKVVSEEQKKAMIEGLKKSRAKASVDEQ